MFHPPAASGEDNLERLINLMTMYRAALVTNKFSQKCFATKVNLFPSSLSNKGAIRTLNINVSHSLNQGEAHGRK